jgi:hypothetical protein
MFMLITINTWLVSVEDASLIDALTLCACNSDMFPGCLSSLIAIIHVGNDVLWMQKHGPRISCFSSLHYSNYEEFDVVYQYYHHLKHLMSCLFKVMFLPKSSI